jgi:FG-GAP repeat protein
VKQIRALCIRLRHLLGGAPAECAIRGGTPVNHKQCLSIVFALLGVSQWAAAQTLIRTHKGPATESEFGRVVAALSDLDGDGVRDYAISDTGYFQRPGSVDVYSGATGANLFSVQGPGDNQFGHSLSDAGDVDGDGVPDLLIGDPGYSDPNRFTWEGRVLVCSGTDGSTIHEYFGGWPLCQLGGFVARLDDLDGDGVSEFLVSARLDSNADSSQHLFAVSGRDGTLLYEIDLDVNNMQAPATVDPRSAGVGVDRDGDGIGDIFMLAGDRQHTLRVCSGASGATLSEFDLGAFIEETWQVSEMSDVDGDGANELLLVGNGYEYADLVAIFSVARGINLRSDEGRAAGALPDFDGDGVGELLLVRYDYASGYKYFLDLHSGRTGGTMASNLPEVSGNPVEIQPLGDVDGDGLLDFSLCPGSSVYYARTVKIHSNDEFWLEADPNPAAPSVVETLTAGCVPAGSPIGIALVDVNGSPMFAFIDVTTADSAGRLVHSETVPPGLSGSSASFQAFAIDRAGHVVDTPPLTVIFK